jgi:hypothetical protein
MAASPSLLKNSWGEFQNLLSMRWQTYFWYVVMSFLIMSVGALLIGSIAYPSVQSVMGLLPEMMNGSLNFSSLVLPNFFLIGLIGLVVGLLSALIKFGAYRVVVNKKAQQTPSAILTQGADRYFWTLLVSIAAGILVFLVVVAGTIALILPGIYLGVGLIFTGFIIILEGKGPVESMGASRAMVSGRWWSVFGTLLFWGLFAVLVSMVMSLIFNLLFASTLNIQTFDSLLNSFAQVLTEASVSGNYDQVSSMGSQIMTQLLNTKTLLAFGLDILLQAASMIVAYYGMLAVYLSLKKMK